MLKQDFNQELQRTHSTPHAAGEIACFDALIRALSKSHYVYVSRVHGNSGMVYHTIQHRPTTYGSKRCEIADLLMFFISEDEVRYTFMQNKRKRGICHNKNLTSESITLIQWDLLHYKCTISNASNKYNFPTKCLSSAVLDSVGTYGFFVNEIAGTVDMVYTIASDMNYSGMLNSINSRVVQINSNYNKVRNVRGYDEVEGTTDLDKFESAGFNMLIGTPLSAMIEENIEQVNELLGIIKTCFKNQSDHKLESLVDQFIANNSINPIEPDAIICNVLIMDCSNSNTKFEKDRF